MHSRCQCKLSPAYSRWLNLDIQPVLSGAFVVGPRLRVEDHFQRSRGDGESLGICRMYTCPRELGKVFLQLFKPPTTVLIITAVKITLVIGAQIHFILHYAFYVVALDS